MNELDESFDARGLTIVGVTSEEKPKTEEWVRRNGVKHAYAYDPDRQLSRFFGVSGIPHAVLLDPGGTVVWRGHPAGLDDAVIESALAGAVTKPLWTWPENTASTRLQLSQRAYAEALASAKQLEGPYAEIVQGLITARLDGIRSAIEAGDYLRAAAAAGHAARDLEGLPEGDQARTLLRGIEEDPRAVSTMEGQRKLARVMEKVASVRLVVEAERLLKELEALRGAYPDTLVASRAAAEIQGLRDRMP